MVVKKGVDVRKVLNFFKVSDSKYSSNLGTAGFAFGLYKILMPARLLLTASIVPVLAHYLGKEEGQEVFDEPTEQQNDNKPI